MTVMSDATGLRIERVTDAAVTFPFAGAARALSNAVSRAIERATVAGAVRAMESGDRARLMRYIERGRDWHNRLSMPSAAHMSAAMDGLSIAPARVPGRASWLRHDDFDDDAILIYVHGGSFIADRSPRLTALIARIAKAARLKTLMVDYRLAPEHPCPAAVDDVCEAVLGALREGYAPTRIGLVAESAGASIALAAALRLRDHGTRLGAIALLSPWTDLALTGRSAAARSLTGETPISMESMAICAHFYLQGRSPLDPLASPVYGDLRGLGPIMIHTSRTDSLHDDARMLANRAHDAGGDVTLRVWASGGHVFERLFDGQSERAIGDIGAFLNARVGAAATRRL
jgi:epsilon-lactone hydrolase